MVPASTLIGPNVKKLIMERASGLTVERAESFEGSKVGGVAMRIADRRFLGDIREASEWVRTAIAAVRAAPGGADYGDDEAIAAKLLDGIAERRKARAGR